MSRCPKDLGVPIVDINVIMGLNLTPTIARIASETNVIMHIPIGTENALFIGMISRS